MLLALPIYLLLIALFFIQFLRVLQLLDTSRSHYFVTIGDARFARYKNNTRYIPRIQRVQRKIFFFQIYLSLFFSSRFFFIRLRQSKSSRCVCVCVCTHDIDTYPKEFTGVTTDEIVLVPVAFPQIFFFNPVNLVATREVKYKSSGKGTKKKKKTLVTTDKRSSVGSLAPGISMLSNAPDQIYTWSHVYFR